MLTPPCLRTAIFSFLASTRRFPHWHEQIRAPRTGVHELGRVPKQISGKCGAGATDSHSRRFFSQSSKYLRAIARSLSLAWASAFVYMSVIQASSGLAASLATMSQNSPSAAWREQTLPFSKNLPAKAPPPPSTFSPYYPHPPSP